MYNVNLERHHGGAIWDCDCWHHKVWTQSNTYCLMYLWFGFTGGMGAIYLKGISHTKPFTKYSHVWGVNIGFASATAVGGAVYCKLESTRQICRWFYFITSNFCIINISLLPLRWYRVRKVVMFGFVARAKLFVCATSIPRVLLHLSSVVTLAQNWGWT